MDYSTAGMGQPAGGRDPYGDGKQYNPKINGQEIVASKLNPDTRGIEAFKLADGTVLSQQEAMDAIVAGNGEGLMVQNNAYGPYIKTAPDGETGNNLDSLPNF